MQKLSKRQPKQALPQTHPEADPFVHVSRVDLDLRPDGEPVLRRVRMSAMLPGDEIVDLGDTTAYAAGPIKAHVTKEATFHLPEMNGPVTLPASRQGQLDTVKRLMEQYRPGQVYGRDYQIGGGAIR